MNWKIKISLNSIFCRYFTALGYNLITDFYKLILIVFGIIILLLFESLIIYNCVNNNIPYSVPVVLYVFNTMFFFILSLFMVIQYDKRYGFINLTLFDYGKQVNNNSYFNKIVWKELESADKEIYYIHNKLNNILCNLYYYTKISMLGWMVFNMAQIIGTTTFMKHIDNSKMVMYQCFVLLNFFILSYNVFDYIKNFFETKSYHIVKLKTFSITYFVFLFMSLSFVVFKNTFNFNDLMFINKNLILSTTDILNLITLVFVMFMSFDMYQKKVKNYKMPIIGSYILINITISLILIKILSQDHTLKVSHLSEYLTPIIPNVIFLILMDFVFCNRRLNLFVKRLKRHGFRMPKIELVNNTAKDILNTIDKHKK